MNTEQHISSPNQEHDSTNASAESVITIQQGSRRELLCCILSLAALVGTCVAVGVKHNTEILEKIQALQKQFQFSFLTNESLSESDISESMISSLAQPIFSGPEFAQQLLQDKNLSLVSYNPQKNTVSFEYRGSGMPDFSRYSFLRNSENVHSLKSIFAGHHTFTTSLENIHFDPHQDLMFQYEDDTFHATPHDLALRARGIGIYGGKYMIALNQHTGFANHARFVECPESTMLQPFVQSILKNSGLRDDAPMSSKIQILLHFVTHHITYDPNDNNGGEVMKKASNTLMTRSGDCSNSTILFASMLEQIGTDYVLVYLKEHILVAVPADEFPKNNDYVFSFDGKEWSFAETTATGFEIGRSIGKGLSVNDIIFVQRPSSPEHIENPHTRKKYFLQ